VKWIIGVIGVTFVLFTVWGLIDLSQQTGDEPMPWQLNIVLGSVAISFVVVVFSYVFPVRKQILKKSCRQR